MRRHSFWGVTLLTLLGLVFNACASKNKHLRRQAAMDLQCSENSITLSTPKRGVPQYLAVGCGRQAMYTYTRASGAVRISEVIGASPTPPSPSESLPPPPEGEVPAPPPPPPPAPL
jgi:hypothetical protein